MIEVIVVLIMLAILGAVVASRVFSTETYELAAQAEVVKTHLRYAQTRAMGSDTIWGIDFNGSTYSLFRNGDTGDTMTLPGEDSDPVTLPSGMSVSGAGIVSFDNWGKPYTDETGGTSQVGERTITVSSGSDTELITITPNTGFVS